MEGNCTCGHDEARRRLEKHEKEMWRFVQSYEDGATVNEQALVDWFKRPRNKEWVGLCDNYISPEIQAIMIFKSGAHKKSIFELLKIK